MRRHCSRAVLVALCAFSAQFLFAAESANKELDKLKGELTGLSKDINKYSAQLDKTMNSLDAIKTADAKKLPKAYKEFDSDAQKLEKDFQTASKGMKSMREQRDKYFKAWEESSASLSSPELKQAADERRAKLKTEHETLASDASAAADRINAFMGKLNDLRKFLGSDLNPPAVTSAAPTINEVLAEGRSLTGPVNTVGGKVSSFANGL